MKFSCIGFDVKTWPWAKDFYSDDTGWDQNDKVYDDLVLQFSLHENEYQLLSIDKQTLLDDVIDYMNAVHNANLIALEIPSDIVQKNDSNYGFVTSTIEIDIGKFTCRGLDVIDYDGIFSVLHHPIIKKTVPNILPVTELNKAQSVIDLANDICPEHSPYTIAKLYTLK